MQPWIDLLSAQQPCSRLPSHAALKCFRPPRSLERVWRAVPGPHADAGTGRYLQGARGANVTCNQGDALGGYWEVACNVELVEDR